MSRLIVARALFALTLAAPIAGAQVPTPDNTTPATSDGIPRPANDSLFRRARRLVSEGNGVAGRALVDSLLAAADPATSAYGDALYWHGAIAPTAAAAEQDYRRVIVEYPLAYYSGDALLAIAELEQARGDRAGAMQHLQRFVREHPENPGRGLAALGVARLAFEQQDSTLACSMLAVARRSTPASDVEVRNQIAYFGNRCVSGSGSTSTSTSVATAPATTAPATVAAPAVTTTSAPEAAPMPTPARRTPEVTRPVATRESMKAAPAREAAKSPVRAAAKAPAREPAKPRAVAKTPAKRATPATKATSAPMAKTRTTTHAESRNEPRTAMRYTVQVAAYPTRDEADALVKRLATRGVKARVSGTSKPFRVRLGLHASRKDAAAEQASLRKRGIDGFVAEESVHAGARTP